MRACEIAWGIYKGVPDVSPPKAERKCLGDVFEVRLEPLGAAKLHMVDLPSIDLSGTGGAELLQCSRLLIGMTATPRSDISLPGIGSS